MAAVLQEYISLNNTLLHVCMYILPAGLCRQMALQCEESSTSTEPVEDTGKIVSFNLEKVCYMTSDPWFWSFHSTI